MTCVAHIVTSLSTSSRPTWRIFNLASLRNYFVHFNFRPIMWVRQEYKPEKARFERPYELDIEVNLESGARKVKLEQSYVGLGTTVWDGSIALAKMFDNKRLFPSEMLKKCSVLELGAGCGLVGIYISLLGAKRTVLTDQKCCIPTLKRNIELNIPNEIVRRRIAAKQYSWGGDAGDLTKDGLFDFVVAAEVLYCEEDSAKLANCIPELTHPSSSVFVSMGRNRLGETIFVRTLKNHGFNVQEICNEDLHPKYQDSIIKVLKAWRT